MVSIVMNMHDTCIQYCAMWTQSINTRMSDTQGKIDKTTRGKSMKNVFEKQRVQKNHCNISSKIPI